MKKSQRKSNLFKTQPINQRELIVENGPEALANPMRNLRPLPNPASFQKFNLIPHLINHLNRDQVVHDIAFPHAMTS